METCKHTDLNSKCPRCESKFHCACKDGCHYCWCFDLPKIDIPKEYQEDDCLCQNCLKELSDIANLKHEEIRKNR